MTTATAEHAEEREVGTTLVSLEAQTRGEVDVQIATAKRFPRSVRDFIQQAESLATLNAEVASSCFYALPRDGKTVEGPSARLAEICASCWGHMRIQARIVDEDDRFLTARGESWDMQNNVAIGYEVRRRITDRNGRKFKDDMIVVTANAASSIALRNAVFKNIPSAFWRPIYEKCRKVAVGDVKTLANRRAEALRQFQQMGVEGPRVFAALNVRGVEDITLEHMERLIGLFTAIKEGDTTVDDAFPAVATVPMPQRVSESPAATAPAPSEGGAPVSSGPAAVSTAAPAPPSSQPDALPAGADRLAACAKQGPSSTGKFWWVVTTERGVQAYTWSTTIGPQLEAFHKEKAAIDLDTEKDNKGNSRITAVQRFDAFGGAGLEPGAQG